MLLLSFSEVYCRLMCSKSSFELGAPSYDSCTPLAVVSAAHKTCLAAGIPMAFGLLLQWSPGEWVRGVAGLCGSGAAFATCLGCRGLLAPSSLSYLCLWIFHLIETHSLRYRTVSAGTSAPPLPLPPPGSAHPPTFGVVIKINLLRKMFCQKICQKLLAPHK